MEALALVVVLLSSVAVRGQNRDCQISELGYACKKQMTDYYALHWSLGPTTKGADVDEGEVAIAMVGMTTGWVGVGFPDEADTMAPADAVLGWVDGDDVVVNAYRPRRNFISIDDLDEDLMLSGVSGMERDGNTTIQFIRRLKGTTNTITLNKRIPVNVAIGKSDRLRYHGFGDNSRQSLFVNFGMPDGQTGGGERSRSTERTSMSAIESTPPEIASPVPSPEIASPVPSPEIASPVPSPEIASPVPSSEIPMPAPSPVTGDGEASVSAPAVTAAEELQRLECMPSDLEYDCMMTVSLVLTIHWTVGPADETGDAPEVSEGEIAMMLVGKTTGWVGICFAEVPGSMFPSDAIIGWVEDDGSGVTVLPYRIRDRLVTNDDEDDRIGLREVSGSENGDLTTISFVWTGELTFDLDLTSAVNMNWAVGEEDGLVYHEIYRGSFAVNLLSPVPELAAEPVGAEEPDGSEELEDLEDNILVMQSDASDSDCLPSDLGYSCLTAASDPVFIHWTLGPAPATDDVPEVMDGEVAIAMVSQTDGWVGVSFAESPGLMVPADAIIGWVNAIGVTVKPYRITERNVSPDDESTDIGIREASGTEEGGNTFIQFIATGNFTFDVNLRDTINMNWAVGPSDSLVQHSRRGSFAIKF